MKILFATCLSACLLAGPAHGADDSAGGKQARQAWLRARIVLDATGKLASLEWIGTRPNDRLVTAPLETLVRGWEFEPGKLDGIPATTETGLLLHVKLGSTAEGGIMLEIDDARTGGIAQTQDPPAYPRDALARGIQAHVLMQVETNASGGFASASILDYESSSTARNARKDFESAALVAVRSWSYRPEQVGGKGLAAVFRVPVSFCITEAWCGRTTDAAPEFRRTASPPGMAVAIDSVVRIRTRTSRVEI